MFGFGKKDKVDAEEQAYKVVYNRQKCIGAGTCAAMSPKQWEMQSDGKAKLVGGSEEGVSWVKMVGESEKAFHLTAAGGCPPQVIEVWDIRTGEKLAPK